MRNFSDRPRRAQIKRNKEKDCREEAMLTNKESTRLIHT